MEAIVLAGGLGTRLRSVVADVPKPMAPVAGRPFLDYILYYLKKQGIRRVILAVGYKWEVIKSYYSQADSRFGLELVFSVEDEPLGTGGAIFNAVGNVLDDTFFLINGDTAFDVPLNELAEFYADSSAEIVLALKQVTETERYGSVECAPNGRIVSFLDKGHNDKPSSAINGGIYLMKKAVMERFNFPARFSFETDFLQSKLSELNAFGKVFDAPFIDIGIPVDYHRAQNLFKNAIDEAI
jgi:D-glycero-alpha-D-manno-heptose 1-phosphate guanylyltransferase